jgi:serine/threonine protein kinase
VNFTAPPNLSPTCHWIGQLADGWSLGAIFFAMQTGRIPLRDIQNQQRLFCDVKIAGFRIPGHLNPNFLNLIKLLMSPQPLVRFTMNQAVWDL